MAYVYDRVAKDQHSQQSPHYGHYDGDGDFIFTAPTLEELSKENEIDEDVLVQVPSELAHYGNLLNEEDLLLITKDYLSDQKYRNRLDDLVANEVRASLYASRKEEFPVDNAPVTIDEFANRLQKYEQSYARLLSIAILIARWGTNDHQSILRRNMARLADNNDQRNGNTVWLGLRWYPLLFIMYSAGIGALSADSYESLSTIFMTKIGSHMSDRDREEVIIAITKGIHEVQRKDLFKSLPGHERQYVPKREYLFKRIQPHVEDMLFLGHDYEDLYDRFEILYALNYAEITTRESDHFWGPPGRFAWKHNYKFGSSPYDALVSEAKTLRDTWAPLHAGMFQGSSKRFLEIASKYREYLANLGWF